MEQTTRIFPRWAHSLGAMLHSKALVRSQCRRCGIQQRVDLEALAAKLGGSTTLIDRTDACSIVACHGQVFYQVARTYGRQWILLVARADLLDALDQAAPACNAQSLEMLPDRGARR